MPTSSLPIVVVGAGIGGLATAIGLARHGRKVRVLERASTLGEIGAGIQLGPNAFHGFDYLGVGDQARAIAVFIDKLRLMDAMTGEEVTNLPLDAPFRKRFGNPYAVVHRGDLHGVLLRACATQPLIELSVSSEIVSYHQDGSSVSAMLATGEKIRGRALIGADGLWSIVRSQMVGDGPPRVSGHSAYRSVIRTENMPEHLRWNAATLWAGPKCHVVNYPLSDWKLFNLVVTRHNGATQAATGVPVPDQDVIGQFAHLAPVVQSIIRHGSNWKYWVLCDREPISDWVDGRVALLGDAAHPMLQYFAQGACMAIEDAVCLAHMVGSSDGDVEPALRRYMDRRRLRTARVQLQSRAIGEHIYHPEGAHAELRNAMMRARSPAEYYEMLQWLYGARADEQAPFA